MAFLLVVGVDNQIFECAVDVYLRLDVALVVLDLAHNGLLVRARLLPQPLPFVLLVLRLRPKVRAVVLTPLILVLRFHLVLKVQQ